MTLLFTDPLFLAHDTGAGHPESAARLRAVTTHLEAAGLLARCVQPSYRPLTEAEVARVHDPAVVALVKAMAARGGGHIESDTVVSSQSFAVGLAAAGACASAVDAVVAGPERNALCLVRPPGHHATPTQSMGFCLFNSIALAARRALDQHQLNRVLVLDWDVHHGNGTQDVFWEDPTVTFLSIHRYGDGFYPGTGTAAETGTGRGLGHTINVPVRYGIRAADYRAAFIRALEQTADKVKPELILISAGFDAHRLDPVGGLCLEAEDFAWMTQAALDVARTHAAGRLVSCLEGGYNLDVLAEAVNLHLNELLSGEASARRNQPAG